MNVIDEHVSGLDDELLKAKQGLLNRIEYWTRETNRIGNETLGLGIYKHTAPSGLTPYSHAPSVCLIAQGSKHIQLGKDEIGYDRDHYLVSSIDLPIIAEIQEASPEKPYMGMAFRLDQKEISELLAEGIMPPPLPKSSSRAMTVVELHLPLLNAFLRLIDLMEEPESIPFLAPPIRREIISRLLLGEGGIHLRQVGMAGSQGSQVLKAVGWLKSNYTQTVMVEELASFCNMSLSAFHHHFRRFTAMSPLQYQKMLRLQEARRLLLTTGNGITEAAFGVGYKSSSQFSREYSRLYGLPPSRDLQSLKSFSV